MQTCPAENVKVGQEGCAAHLTQLLQPLSLLDNAANATGINVFHEFPEQGADGRGSYSQLLQVGNKDADGLLLRPVLKKQREKID